MPCVWSAAGERRLLLGVLPASVAAVKKAALKPFFKFYGGKWRAAHLYPPPLADVPLIEPFAGSAGYALNYPTREVRLYDVDPIIVGLWDYLIHVSDAEILALPDLDFGVDVNSLSLPQEARWLIGFWLNSGSAQPKRTMSSGARIERARSSYWGPHARQRIAEQLPVIRHWTVAQASYEQVPNEQATWFIDPPYAAAGSHYRYRIADYRKLGAWCRERVGLVIVCESSTATWLPFEVLAPTQAFKSAKPSPEGVYLRRADNRDGVGGAGHDQRAADVLAERPDPAV